jgi:hypothetical protein
MTNTARRNERHELRIDRVGLMNMASSERVRPSRVKFDFRKMKDRADAGNPVLVAARRLV